MGNLSSDRDVLRYEPSLFSEHYLASQVLVDGSDGVLSGTSFSSVGSAFQSGGVEVGDVLYVNDGVNSYLLEVVFVVSETVMTVSVLREDVADDAVVNFAGSALTFRVATFRPQAKDVAIELTRRFGIGPGDASSDYSIDDLCDSSALMRASVSLVIAGVYTSISTGDDAYAKKSIRYREIASREIERCRLDIDVNEDGVRDASRFACSGRLLRD